LIEQQIAPGYIMKNKNSAPGQVLDNEKIIFDPASKVDPFGRVFRYEGLIYRTVAHESGALARDILAKIPEWTPYGLIETSESGYQLADAVMVLSHRTIDLRSYCSEWLPEMLKDAALTYLRLQIRLIQDQYLLKDGHPWNFLFDHGRPIYIDVGSIIPYEKSRLNQALAEFRLYFLLPLRLFSLWGSARAYAFLNAPIPNDAEREKIAFEIGLEQLHIPRWYGITFFLNSLIRKINRMKVQRVEPTEWSDYEQKAPDLFRPESFIDKQRPAYEILRRVGSGTLLDIGCNKGWFSLLAEDLGFKVVAIDIDLKSLAELYKLTKSGHKNILPLYVDFYKPTGVNGVDGAYPPFVDRMRCDIVLAMAITHHLAYKAMMSFDAMAGRIAQLTGNVAIVEFIPREDIHVCEWSQDGMDWYTRENFITMFMQYFDRMEVYPSTPLPREVFVFEKKSSA
jgi:hypothetical protein